MAEQVKKTCVNKTEKMDTSDSSMKQANFGEQSYVDSFSQRAFGSLVSAIKSSTALPSPGDDYEFYSSFSGVRQFYQSQGSRLLENITQIIRHQGIHGNVREDSKAYEIEDKLDVITEANDVILERVGTLLDEASGFNKNAKPVLPPGAKDNIVISSWNRKSQKRHGGADFKLLHAKNIQRPQLKFKEKVDNSNVPFVPILKYKPNAIKPLQRVPAEERNDDVTPTAISDFIHQQRQATGQQQMTEDVPDIFSHPYQYELDHFQPLVSQMESSEPVMYKSLNDTPLNMIKTVEELRALSETLNKQKEFAVDLEHHSYRSFQGFTCLMQISTRDEDYIVDTIELRSDLNILNESFSNPSIVKIFHGADMDVCWLQRDFGIYVVNMFDTGQASRVLGFSQFSLSYLLQHYCHVVADKQFQLADWRIRPLPEELLKYAREDTHYLLYIYDMMRNALIEKGNAQLNLLKSTLDRSKEVCLKKYQKLLFTEESYNILFRKNRKIFNSQRLKCFKLLYAWRDRIARQEDESYHYVLPNHMLFQIAEVLPKEAQGILACCNPIPPLVRQHVNEIHQFVRQAREQPIEKVETSTKKTEELKFGYTNIEKMLHCPHDMTHWNEEDSMETDSAPISNQSALFSKKDAKGLVTSNPIISIFGYSVNKMTAGLKKVEVIKASFVSPFEKYLPKKTVSQIPSSILESDKITIDGKEAEIQAEHVRPTIENDLWKMKPSTDVKPSEASSKKVTINRGDSAKKRQRVESEEEPAKSLREQGVPKKKRKWMEKEVAKKDKASTSVDNRHSEGRVFHPFDYTKADYKAFEETKKSKKKSSATGGRQGSSFQNAPRSRTAPHTGKKSMTYSSHPKGGHQKGRFNWPKK